MNKSSTSIAPPDPFTISRKTVKMDSKMNMNISKIDKFLCSPDNFFPCNEEVKSLLKLKMLNQKRTCNKLINKHKGIINPKKRHFKRQIPRMKKQIPEVSDLFIVVQMTNCIQCM